ncbi:peptidase domain-containing ABC transporter, partial [Vibrio alginolyticus]|nr:peptidase domain-containing ABC transporter [Vibrio alginolyticus]
MEVSNISDKITTQSLDLLSFSGLKRVPIILQSEVSECGLACLAMISSFYGHKVNVSSLRSHMKLGLQGMNLKQVIHIADQLHLAGRGVKCEAEDISHLALPCILHWNLDHFVVLTKVSSRHVYINDPAFGRRKLTLAQFSQSFTGIALELTPTAKFEKNDTSKTIRINQLWEKVTGLKRTLGTLLILSLLLQFSALISPYYMQWVIDNVLLSNDKPLLFVLASGFALLNLVQILISAFRSWIVIRLSSALNIQMGANLFQHMIRLPLLYFEKRHVGDVVSRFSSLNSIRELFTTGLVETFIDGVMAIVVIIMMYLYHPMLATLVLGFVFTSFIIQVFF